MKKLVILIFYIFSIICLGQESDVWKLSKEDNLYWDNGYITYFSVLIKNANNEADIDILFLQSTKDERVLSFFLAIGKFTSCVIDKLTGIIIVKNLSESANILNIEIRNSKTDETVYVKKLLLAPDELFNLYIIK